MGYTTEFRGAFDLDRRLSVEHEQYLSDFAATRRMNRNAELTAKRPDPAREAVGLPVGEGGGYFVGATSPYGQEHTDDVIDFNSPPSGQPGLWCQWVPREAGLTIEWDGGEKFYDYVEWIEYLIQHFLGPWGYKLNGIVEWRGEDWEDLGAIRIEDNVVQTTSR